MSLTGKKYDRLTVIKYSHTDKHRFKVWECECSCGNIVYRTTNNLNRRPELGKHCGCKRKEQDPDTPFNEVISIYKRNLKKRKRELKFELTLLDVKRLIKSQCHYCNVSPSNILRKHNEYDKHRSKITVGFKYNGIDRIDNVKGYTVDNCVPCCRLCNRMKKGLTYDQFITKVQQIAVHMGIVNG